MLKKALITGLLVGMSSVAMAGPWTVKVGASVLVPDSDNGTLVGGAVHPDVSTEANFTPSIEYAFGETPWSVELLLAAPFKHDVKLPEVNSTATFKHLPPTITAKYNFKNSSRFTPYIGVGATIVVPWDEKVSGALAGAKLEADESYGIAGQVGFKFQPADAKNWGVYADVRYAQVESDLKLNGDKIGTLDVNPWIYTLGYSYNF